MNLLDELTIYFTERALRGEGMCTFTIPRGALEALYDVHTYVFDLPENKKQVCLRVCFDMGKETIRRRYEFPVDEDDFDASLFLRMTLEVSETAISSIPLDETDDFENGPFERLMQAWITATEGLVAKTYGDGGFRKRPTRGQLKAGWERVAGY